MKYTAKDHTFAICAYKESIYLEKCVCSLRQQSVKSNIIMCTSTPNEHIQDLSHKYDIPLFINPLKAGITSDWNFAYSCADTELVTLAHQDDIYDPKFTAKVLQSLNTKGMSQITFTDYDEIQNDKRITSKEFLNLRIKKILLAPLRIRRLQDNIWIRRRILSLGNPIACPSVTYVKKNLPEIVFEAEFASNVDWLAWEKLSRRKGRFLYIPETLMAHRMYEDSTTMKMIREENSRTKEDLQMLKRFWPKPLAHILCALYSQSQRTREK